MMTWAEYVLLGQPVKQVIEVALKKAIDRKTKGVPKLLAEAMKYSLLAPGKRLRPFLVILAYQLVAGVIRRDRIETLILPAALAVEMVHCYSLIHDDLPAMDDDDLRRGLPTCHKKFDEATAILAGDALLTLAFELLSEINTEDPALPGICSGELAHAAGMAGMIGGQMDDIEAEGKTTGDLRLLQSIHRRKTGALIRASLRLGALLALDDSQCTCVEKEKQLRCVTSYADSLGMVFQITDDLLDVSSNSTTLGKRTQKDASKGKLTYPGLLGVEETRRYLKRMKNKGIRTLRTFGDRAQPLITLLEQIAERDR